MLGLDGLEGIFCEREWVVEEGHAAAHLRSRGLEVLATPYMLLYGEVTARECLDRRLPEDIVSVGVEALVRHLAPVPVGGRVLVNARIVGVAGRSVSVLVRVTRDDGVIAGEIYHVRRVVSLEDLKTVSNRLRRGGLEGRNLFTLNSNRVSFITIFR
ncbi:thioesterase family protein [Aeropyrum camini]|uniref:thioesterase family protein n=1 Tax=Aeropyrum camini TaxID=229980 RepID=UPI00210E566C|nr:thioesterase family protein [Aeropyrum camini]